MDERELKELHGKILEIAEYFDVFCQENDITYYLMGGTALGAIRHQGFIPWDDDFDVFMDHENYAKFLQVASTKLDTERFYFQKEDTPEWPMYFSKIRMNNTTFIEKDLVGREMHHGIYIDIMCLNHAPSCTPVRYLQYLGARVLNAKALGERGYITESLLKKTMLFVAKYMIRGCVQKGLLSFVRSFNHKKRTLAGHFFGRAPFLRTSFPQTYLGQARYVRFEHLSLPVPSQAEAYLAIRYGDRYMELPSDKEKMKYPSHAYLVDVSTSYKEFQL